MGQGTIDSKSLYRISDFALLKLIPKIDYQAFYRTAEEQYLQAVDQNLTVWYSGAFAKRINKIYSNPALYDPVASGQQVSLQYDILEVLIKQGTRFDSCFGFLVVVQSLSGDITYASRMFTIDELKFTDNMQLIDGCFWTTKVSINIPKVDDTLLKVSIVKVPIAEIEFGEANIGMIYTYPNELEPLVYEKPTPDFITTQITTDISGFITIGSYTTENKTLEQSILDYFNQTMANISISHVVKYGDLSGTTEASFDSIRISNEVNQYEPVKIGLDYSKFLQQKLSQITVFVSTEILVDGKLMKREVSQIVNVLDILNPTIMNQIQNPDTIFPVSITENTVIENTVIETNIETKIVPIHQPIYVELIADTIKVENKDVTFANLQKPAYLRINSSENNEEQIILSKETAEGKIYFDLSQLIPIAEETTYDLISAFESKIIGHGKVTL